MGDAGDRSLSVDPISAKRDITSIAQPERKWCEPTDWTRTNVKVNRLLYPSFL